MNYKICVYAICKNETEWIDRWLDNMSEADYIVVLDTGSTDGSFEMLKTDPRVTRVEQKIITPWRFDVARNESMKLVPDDADILVCTDFDEIFEEGWAKILREHWQPDDDRCYYTYAWSHNSLGEPQDVFIYDKIHTRDYYWKFPVHEVLYPKDMNKVENILHAGEHIYLHHLQDMSKPRNYYFDLLNLSVDENPENAHCRMLLAREYLLKKDYQEAINQYLKCLDYEEIYLPRNKLVLLETYGRLGDLYGWNETEDFSKSMYYYSMFLKTDSSYREPYLCMADIYNNKGLYTLAEATIQTGLKYSVRHYDWVERSDFWIAKADELLLTTYLGLNDYKKAAIHGKIALEHNPDDLILLKQYNTALEKLLEIDRSSEIEI